MASPTPLYRILCLVICVGLAWFSVVAKPVELPALSQRRYISSSSSPVVDGVGAVRNGSTRGVQDHLPATLTIEKPACVDPDRCRSGFVVTDATPSTHTIACSPPPSCSLDGKSLSATYSCHTLGSETVKFDALPSVLARPNVAPFSHLRNHEHWPAPYEAAHPEMTGASDATILPSSLGPAPSKETITHTARLTVDQNGEPGEPAMTPSPEEAPSLVPGQQTVYVTITEGSTTASPIPTAPFSTQPLSAGHPEPKETAIILGSVFGFLAVLCVLIVSADHLLKLRRQKREDLQECEEQHESAPSVEDMSELLRQQQQTYGYYGTQRVASSSIVPQQMKVLPASSEPVELPTPK